MPVKHTKLNLTDVMDILRKRGYAFHSQYGVGIRLTKKDMRPDAVFKSSGRRRRIPLVPVTPKDLDEILTYARNEKEAADQLERISLGVQNAPEWNHPGAPGTESGQQQIDPDLIQKLVENRVNSVIANQSKQSDQMLASLKTQLEEAQKELAALKAKPKRGRPPGSKNKKKPAAKSKDGEPELDADQEAAFQKAMSAEAREMAGLKDE